jgi:type II secretion system (T2SS) protein G
MNCQRIRTTLLFLALGCALIAINVVEARADLSQQQARKALTRIAGFELKSNSVRVKSVSASSPSSAEVIADVRAVFKFQADKDGKWRVDEIRTGQESWDEISLIAKAGGASLNTGGCNAPDPPLKGKSAVDPSVKRARCLIGSLLGIDVPSDAVRIQEVDPSPIPMASQPSALVVSWVRFEAKLLKDKSGWRVTEFRTGNRDWVNVENFTAAINQQKQERARAEMALLAGALEKFRKDRGSYVVSDSHGVAIDHLSPRYLGQVIRLDPWGKPYKYHGERESFSLRSLGPDGKPDNADDLQVTGPSR